MAGVNPLVYVISGAVVSTVSLLVGEEFKWFFYVGIGAVVFGAVSGFIGAMQYHGAKRAEEKGLKQTQQTIAKKYPDYAKQHFQMRVKYCNRCGMQAPLDAAFCQRCGSRV
jgi:ribosomal protein L40E